MDLETGEVRVLRLVGVHDVGRAINPMLAELISVVITRLLITRRWTYTEIRIISKRSPHFFNFFSRIQNTSLLTIVNIGLESVAMLRENSIRQL